MRNHISKYEYILHQKYNQVLHKKEQIKGQVNIKVFLEYALKNSNVTKP